MSSSKWGDPLSWRENHVAKPAFGFLAIGNSATSTVCFVISVNRLTTKPRTNLVLRAQLQMDFRRAAAPPRSRRGLSPPSQPKKAAAVRPEPRVLCGSRSRLAGPSSPAFRGRADIREPRAGVPCPEAPRRPGNGNREVQTAVLTIRVLVACGSLQATSGDISRGLGHQAALAEPQPGGLVHRGGTPGGCASVPPLAFQITQKLSKNHPL